MAAEQYDLTFQKGRRAPFDLVPVRHRRRVHDVDYVAVKGLRGGDLWMTREGWSMAESLLPNHWYDDQRFRTIGRALTGGTGSVYRVPVPHRARRGVGLVVKFCRFGQDVGLTMVGDVSEFPWPASLIQSAHFLGPFEEFGALTRLRRQVAQGRGPVVRTKRPLAIYAPPTRHRVWTLGRTEHLFQWQARELSDDQVRRPEQPPVAYDPERLYVLLYQWIDGLDAEQAMLAGLLDHDAMVALGTQAAADVVAHGFAVLDHKPRHVIVRRDHDGSLLRRRGRTPFALIDYELLVPLGG